MTTPVTTVVMTRNRRADLARTMYRHDPPIILVDNGSVDDTVAWTRRHFPEVKIIRFSSNVGAVARNRGVEAATTPYVAFADDDSWWEEGALTRAAELMDLHPKIGLVAGRVLVGEDNRLDPVCAAMAESPLPRTEELPTMPSVLGFVACGAVVRREAFLEAGGFDPVVRFPGEEERLALDMAAAGWDRLYVDYVTAHHVPSSQRQATLWRQSLERRNELLTAAMRRPWPVVGGLAARQLIGGPAGGLALARAAARMPRALLRRRPISRDLEEQRRLLG